MVSPVSGCQLPPAASFLYSAACHVTCNLACSYGGLHANQQNHNQIARYELPIIQACTFSFQQNIFQQNLIEPLLIPVRLSICPELYLQGNVPIH